ncbi:MAG: DEAD/DEAH box helicase [Alphaproteobacteria bacterium]|nr:DEAD/DEAH box helicase [Alphaproteobacteria bacterium]MBN2674852.1 DEAD/DEAH box helicase [Alphaproteobacteria bacterium]
MTFESLKLSESILKSLEKIHFKIPTTVQSETIPLILAGSDVLVSSQTGTGKTAAFGIPIISNLMDNLGDSALIITPTRELATQILKTFEDFIGYKSPIRTALLIGGESIPKQLQKLKLNPNIIVGTPGRISDHLKRRSLALKDVKFLVLDETDRMLDMGFLNQIDEIVKHVPKNRQTLLFSATLPANIIKLSEKYMNNPKRISVGSTFNPIEKIKQEVIKLNDEAKFPTLIEQLNKREGSVLIFVKTKYGSERMVKKLRAEKFDTDCIHGDLSQNKRDRVIRDFRNQKFRILVATDIVARGLDIPHIQHVINYDITQCPEDYIHRIGRTARAGQEGEALSFVSPSESKKWDAIYYMMNPGSKKPAAADDKPRRTGSGQRSGNNNSGRDNKSRRSSGGFKPKFAGQRRRKPTR